MDLKMSPGANTEDTINESNAFESQVQSGDNCVDDSHFKCPELDSSGDGNELEKSPLSEDTDESKSEIDVTISSDVSLMNNAIHESNLDDSIFSISSMNDSSHIQSHVVNQDHLEIIPEPTRAVVDDSLACQDVNTKDEIDTRSTETSNLTCHKNKHKQMTTLENEISPRNENMCCVPNNLNDSSGNVICGKDVVINSQHRDAAAILYSLALDNKSGEIEKPAEHPDSKQYNMPTEYIPISSDFSVIPFENHSALEEYDSDSTIPISPCKTDNLPSCKRPSDAKTNVPSSSRVKCFSPLPSTSSDYVTFDLNDMRFNESEGYQKSTEPVEIPRCESPFIVVDGDTASSETFLATNSEVVQVSSVETLIVDNDGPIIICENDNQPITVDLVNDSYKTNKIIDPNEVIDLLGDDSDCEIIDVDKTDNQCVEVVIAPINLSMTDDVNFVENTFTDDLTSSRNENNNSPATRLGTALPIDVETLPSPSLDDFGNSIENDSLNVYLESLLETIEPLLSNIHDRVTISGRERLPKLRKRRHSKRDSVLSKRRRSIDVVDLSETSVSNIPMNSRDLALGSGPVHMTQMSMGHLSISYPIYQPSGVNPVIHRPQIPIPAYPPNNPSVSNVLHESPKSYLGECPVCYETLLISATASTFCGHVFCLECIKMVMKTSKKCPKCRKALVGKGFHQLFL